MSTHSGTLLAVREPADPTPAKRRRVPPLAPEDRRAAIVAATVPLLAQHGQRISTRQIALAAGVAEGTIFRVFADKSSLILVALKSALDPQAAVEAVRALRDDPGLGPRERILAALRILIQRVMENRALLVAFRDTAFRYLDKNPDPTETPGAAATAGPGPDPAERGCPHDPKAISASHRMVMAEVKRTRHQVEAALAELIEPDADRFRCDPATAARLLFSVALAAVGPFAETDPDNPASQDVIGSLLLDGLMVPDPHPSTATARKEPQC